jgi:tetratricopeptide (TPR) repeat protein
MCMAETFKYRAFLSYSHADNGVAKRVHGRLEGFHIDKDLVGRNTPAGPIPATLRPIFRDRQDFDAGASLADETILALDGSAALIVLASPHAARSKFVNEELRQFKLRHPDRPVIPLIVDAETGDVEEECFPPALRFAVAPDGAVTDRPVDVLAADLREKGDGFELALAKVVARLIGLAPDDVYRRAERERRKQGRLRTAIAAVIVVLAIAGGGFYWQSRQQQQTLAEISALVDKYSLVTPAEANVPGAKVSLTQAITAIAQGAASDPRYAKALELLKAGKPKDAEPLLQAVAEDKVKRAGSDAKDAAAAYRNLASITAVSDPGRARDDYAQAAKLDPSNMLGMYWNGWYQQDAGQLDAAQTAYAQVIAAAKPGTDDDALLGAELGTGDIQDQRGNLGAALATYQGAKELAGRLATSDPGSVLWQRELALSDNKIGAVEVPQGNLAAALASYQAGFAIFERIASSDPGNNDRQRDLELSYNNIGDVQVAQSSMAAALSSYQESLAIADRLATSDPGNTKWQRDLSVSYNRVGDAQVQLSSLPAALSSYQSGLAIAQRLAKSDPGNGGWQRDLAAAYNKVSEVQVGMNDLFAALSSSQEGFAIFDRLAKSDPGNTRRQSDLANASSDVGDVQLAQGNLLAALSSYQAGVAIFDGLVKTDPGNTEWQRGLSVFHASIAKVYKKANQAPKAGVELAAARAIIVQLIAQHPDTSEWKQDLAWLDQQIAALKN